MKNSILLFLAPLCVVGSEIDRTPNPYKERFKRTNPSPSDGHLIDLVKWFGDSDGRLNRKIDIRRTDATDPESPFGLFAMGEILGKELIMSIPRNKFIVPDKKPEDLIKSALPCETAFKLIEEIEKGNSSEFSGYMSFLKNQVSNELPSSWSPAGKELLNTILEELPPDDATTWIEQEWHKECEGIEDPEKENLALMLISRGWDYIMVPMYDLMNHRNGNYFNTKSGSVFNNSTEVLQVRSTRRIKAGEQIYTSYNLCHECDARKDNYGTPEILRDYGFVEDYPQRWIFDDILKFEIRDKSEINIEAETDVQRLVLPKDDSLVFEWLNEEKLTEEDKNFIEEELERLMELTDTKIKSAIATVPKKELDVIIKYHSTLTHALSMALENMPTFEECDSASEIIAEEL